MEWNNLNQFNIISNDYLYEIQGGGWLALVGAGLLITGGIILCASGIGTLVGTKAIGDGIGLLVAGTIAMVGGAIILDSK